MSGNSSLFIGSLFGPGDFPDQYGVDINFKNSDGNYAISRAGRSVGPIRPFSVNIFKLPSGPGIPRNIFFDLGGDNTIVITEQAVYSYTVSYFGGTRFSCTPASLPTSPSALEVIITDMIDIITYSVIIDWPPGGGSVLEATAIVSTQADPITGAATGSRRDSITVLPEGNAPLLGGLLRFSCSKSDKQIDIDKAKKDLPIITIDAMSAGEGQNFGEVFVTILDKQKHRGIYNCKYKYTKEGVLSEFSEFPQFNCIIKAEGCTITEKCMWLILNHKLDITLDEFMGRMALYMYARWTLSRFLWRKFNVCFLAKDLWSKFLKDLQASPEFSVFLPIFVDPQYGVVGYDKYFKERCDCGCTCR